MNYLGAEQFGVWATLVSIVGLLAFADLGIGNSVLNMVATASANEDRQRIRVVVATALFTLAAIAALLGLLLSVLVTRMDLRPTLGLSQNFDIENLERALILFIFLFCLNLPTAVVQRLQYALGMGQLYGVSQALGGIFSIVGLYLVTQHDYGLTGALCATLGMSILATWISAIPLCIGRRKIGFSPKFVSKHCAREILGEASGFFFLGMAFCVCQLSDNLIIGSTSGAAEVATYAVHVKYLSPIAFLATLFLTPLWPAYADSHARGDREWIGRALKKSLIYIGIGSILLAGIAILLAEHAMKAWISNTFHVDYMLLLAISGWMVVELIGKSYTAFLNGVGLLSKQLILAAIFVPTCLFVKFAAAQKFGPIGVPIAMLTVFGILHIPIYHLLAKKYITCSISAS